MSKPRERPYHQPGYSLEWNATDCARSLLKRFEYLTARRTSQEKCEVLDGFNDLARDLIACRQRDRDAVRGGEVLRDEEGE